MSDNESQTENGDSPHVSGPRFSLDRRLVIGLNVAIMVLAATALIVLINWIATRKSIQADWSNVEPPPPPLTQAQVRAREQAQLARKAQAQRAFELAMVALEQGELAREQADRDRERAARLNVLSERTRKIVRTTSQPIRLTVLYDSKNVRKIRDEITGVEFKPRVLAAAEAVRLLAPDSIVDDVATPQQRVDLAKRLDRILRRDAGEYVQTIERFAASQPSWTAAIDAETIRLAKLATDEQSWAGGFEATQLACLQLQELSKDLAKARQDIAGVATSAPESGAAGAAGANLLTAFDAQADVLKAALSRAVTGLDGAGQAVGQLSSLQKKVAAIPTTQPRTTQPDSGGAAGNVLAASKTLRQEIDKELKTVRAMLEECKRKPPATQPADAFLPHLDRLGDLLRRQQKVLSDFSADQPALRRYHGWIVMIDRNRGGLLENMFVALPGQILSTVATDMSDPDSASGFQQYADDWLKGVIQAATIVDVLYGKLDQAIANLRRVDAASGRLLADVQGGRFLADVTRQVREMNEQLNKLPPLKSRGLADRFKQENLVLVQIGESVPKVLEFNDVWPEAVARGEMDMREPTQGPQRRTNDLDGALGSALFSLALPNIAEAVFVYYSAQPMPNPMGGPPEQAEEGEIPYSALTILRDRLEKANVRVSEWNLANGLEPPPPAYADKEDSSASPAAPPASQPDKRALPRVYVVLPPPTKAHAGTPDSDEDAAPPNPEGPNPDRGAKFGKSQREAVTSVIAAGGNAIFLANWGLPRQDPPMSQFGLPAKPYTAKYEWNGYLASQWGLSVANDYRVFQGIPAGSDRWNLSPMRLSHMLVNLFNQANPIGKSLHGRRILLLHAAPINVTTAPDDVVQQVILAIPAGDKSFWATKDVLGIFEKLQNQEEGAIPKADGDMLPPLPLMVQAKRSGRKAGQPATQPESSVIVFSAGLSLIDPYLKQNVLKLSEEEGVRPEDPPKLNPDIVIDSVYSLAGLDQWIPDPPAAVQPPLAAIVLAPVMEPVKVKGPPPASQPLVQIKPEDRPKVNAIMLGFLPLGVLLIGGVVVLVRRMR